MQNTLNKMIARMFADKKRQKRIVAIICVLSVLVTTTVFNELMQPVITMTTDPVCGQSEHAHGADCFSSLLSCGMEESEEHAHGEDCYKSIMVCGLSEHAHVEACYPEKIEEQTVTVPESTEVPAEATEVPAEPAVMSISEEEEPTEAPVEATAEPTAEATVEATAEPTAEATAEATAEPTAEATAEVTAEPTAEATAEPTVEPTAPTVAVTAVSAEKVFVGQTVTWTVEAAGAAELTYYIADETGAEIVSGAPAADATYISWLADRAGAFTLTVTAANANGSAEAAGTVTVEASEALVAAALADQLSCFAGEEITFRFAYSGGVEPASVRIVVDQDGETLAELNEFAETVTVIPAEVGEVVTTVTAEITVTDSVGNTVTGVCEIPCAVRTRETESDWEKSTRVELTGEWPEDLIAVAETQLGYEESEINFIVNDEGERQGYTRYGQWYGSSYAEWCAMFVSFDLNYAEIPEKYFPREANCEKWISALKSHGLYEAAEDYEPEVGDLVFFDWEDNDESDHVGIVTKVTEKKIETIEGNADKGVRRREYDRDDEVLYGYGCVLEAYETYLRDELGLDLEAGVGAAAIVTAETANLRAEADAESELVAQLPAETVVTVNASEQNRAEIWYQVSAGEQTGWLRSDLVEINYIAEENLVPVIGDYDSLMNRIAELPFDGTEEHSLAAAGIADEAAFAYESGILTDDQYAEILSLLSEESVAATDAEIMTLEEDGKITVTFEIDESAYISDNQTSHVRIESEELYQLYAASGMTTATTPWEGQTGWYKVTSTGILAQFEIDAGSTLSAAGLDTPDVEIYNLTNTTLNNTYISSYSWVTKDEDENATVCGADTVFTENTTLYLQLYKSTDSYYLDYVCCESCNKSISFATGSLYAHPTVKLGSAVSDEYIPKAAAVNSVFECDNTDPEAGCINNCRTADNGRVFNGWYLRKTNDTTDTGMIVFDSTVKITGDYLNASKYGNAIKVYAKWADAPKTVTNLTFNDSTGVSLGSVAEVAYGTTIDELVAANLISAPAQENCEFIGWTFGDGSQIVDGTHKLTASDTIYRAVYNAKVYVHVPDVAGGNPDVHTTTEYTVQTGQKLLTAVDALGNPISEALELDTAIVNGYVFSGWTLEQGSDTPQPGVTDFSNTTAIASVDLTAQYSNAITITFRYLSADDLDGNSALDDYVIVATYYCTEGGNLWNAVDAEGNPASTEPPVVQGYTVNWYAGGWYQALNGNNYSDFVVTGTATPLPTVTFQYTVTGDDTGSVTKVAATYRVPTSGATLAETIAANTNVDTADAQLPECPLVMDTQYFSHWATADGTNAEDMMATAIAANTVYEAVFADKIPVKFQYSYYDEETRADVNGIAAECYAIPGRPLSDVMDELPVLKIPGQRFNGWILMNADDTHTDITLETVVTLAEGKTEVVYVADLETVITLSFIYTDVTDSDADGDTTDVITYAEYTMLPDNPLSTAIRTVVGEDGTETVETLTELPTPPTLENYRFIGWYYPADGETAEQLTSLEDYAYNDTVFTGVYEEHHGWTVTFHDIDPDGNEKLPEGIESIDVLVPDGEALADYLPEVALSGRQASEVIKWYTIADGVKTAFDPTQPVTSDLDLYTYTYRIVLTLASETEAAQTASLLDVLMPKAYAAAKITLNTSEGTLTIEIADGEMLKASDFVIENADGTFTDYTMYTWVDADGNEVDLYDDLIGTEITKSLNLTTAEDTKVAVSDTNTAVKFYVSIDGEWQLVTTMSDVDLYEVQGAETTSDYEYSHSARSKGTTYYYYYKDTTTENTAFISQALLESVYGQYGYTVGDGNVAGNFPYSSDDGENVVSNTVTTSGTTQFSAVADYSGGGTRAWFRDTSRNSTNPDSTSNPDPDKYSDTVAAERPSTVSIYYMPNSTVTDGSDADNYASANSFWSITVDDSSNLVYGADETVPTIDDYVLNNSGTRTVTLKTPVADENGNMPEWSAANATLTKVQDNADGTTTYTLSNATGAVTISATIPGSYTIIYQIPNDETELEQIDNYGVNYAASGQSWVSLPKIQESAEYEDVVVLGEGEEYIVLEPDSSTAKSRFVTANKVHTDPTDSSTIKTNDYFYATYTFVGWKVDGDAETTVNARDGLTEEELKVLDEDGDGIITLTPDWSINPDGDDDVVNWGNTTDHRAYDTCSFWVVLSTSINDSMEDTNVLANYYSDCLYTTDVDNPNDIAPDPLIAASTTTEKTDAAANARIKKLATDPYNGVSLGDFPSDATILANLVDWLTRDGNDDAAVYVDGVAIDPATLTTENYTIRWYVFKYQGDGWHVDGKLIPRNGMIRVTKSFYGNAEAIAAVKDEENGFSITATETNNTSTAYTLNLTQKSDANPYGYVKYDAATDTYTWLLTVKKDTQYTITESNYEVERGTVDGTEVSVAYLPEYMITAEGQWHTYPKETGVTVTAKSYWADTDAGEVEAVNLLNSYIPTNTMILRKVDGNSGQPVNQAVSFVLRKDGIIYPNLHYVEDTDTYYLYAHTGAEHVENGVITVGTSGSVVIVGLKEATGTGTTATTGNFTLTEVTPPTGYNRIPDVGFTITTTGDSVNGYDSVITVTNGTDDNKVVYAETTNNYTLRVKNFPKTSRVIAKKVWELPSGEIALPVTFQLYRNGVSMGDAYKVVLDGTVDTAGSGETAAWTCVWDGLPLYVDGAVADYRILETWIGTAGAAGSVSYDPNADVMDGYENYEVTNADVVYTFNSDNSTGSSPYNAEKNEYANVATLVVTNRKETGKITFDKVDPSGNPVAGASFTLYRTDGTTIQAAATSNSEGDVEFPMVPSGTYYLLKETGTPAGYCEDTTQYKVVITGSSPVIYAPSKDANGNIVYDANGKIVYDTTPVTSIVNVPENVDLTLNKIDAAGQALAGAEFELRKKNSGDTYAKVDGYFTTDGTKTSWDLNDLEAGEYRIVETKAPDGYYMMSETIDFTVANGSVTMTATAGKGWTYDADTQTFTVTNTPGVELPSTGGAGTQMYTMGGLLLMAASLLYGIGQRRKRERGDEI